MPQERLRECWPSSPSRSSPFTARWRGSLSLVPKFWTINSSTLACFRTFQVRTPARQGFPILLASGWLPGALAPGTKSPVKTHSGPHRDDWRPQTAYGCASFAELGRANLRTIGNPVENRALRQRSSLAAAPVQPGTSFETTLLRALAWAAALTGPGPAAHRR